MWGMDRYKLRGRNMRMLALGMILVGLTAGYVLVLRHFRVSELPGERHIGTAGVQPAGEVYFEPIGVDSLNEAMQMRVYLSRSVSDGKNAPTARVQNLTLFVSHDETVEEVKLLATDHIASTTFEIDLNGVNGGSVARYPLDTYEARFGTQLVADTSSVRLPMRVTIWERVLGYNLNTTSYPGPDPNDLQLTTAIGRSGAFVMFAICAYGAMIVLACCALAIGILTFSGVRRPEPTLVGALAAIVFALPVLRNTLPGTPPLGVDADIWAFLWAQLATVLGVALHVYKWMRTSPRP